MAFQVDRVIGERVGQDEGIGEAVGGANEGDDGGVGDALFGGLLGDGFDQFRVADFQDLHGFALLGLELRRSRSSRAVRDGLPVIVGRGGRRSHPPVHSASGQSRPARSPQHRLAAHHDLPGGNLEAEVINRDGAIRVALRHVVEGDHGTSSVADLVDHLVEATS